MRRRAAALTLLVLIAGCGGPVPALETASRTAGAVVAPPKPPPACGECCHPLPATLRTSVPAELLARALQHPTRWAPSLR